MKVLFISTSIPPYTDMQTIRNAFLLQSLYSRGHDVTIVSADHPWGDSSLLNMLPSELNIVRTKVPFFVGLQRFLMKSAIFKPLLKVFNVASNIILIPDIQMLWEHQAIRKVKQLLKSKKYDAVITSSGSYTAHIVGSWVKKNHNIVWIAEYGDPWGFDLYGNIKKTNYKIEQKLLRNCDGLVFTTETTGEVYQKNTSFTKDSIKIVPCGFEYIIEDMLLREKKDKKITYTGVAYASSRNLSNAIRAIGRSQSPEGLQLEMVGTFSDKYKDEAEKLGNKKIIFTGRVSYKKSLDIIADTDILLHIGNKGIMQVPGKTYIYLGSKKPILYIRQEQNDPTFELLKKFGGVECCENDENSILQALSKILSNYTSYKEAAERRAMDKKLERYKWSRLGQEFAEFVENSALK
ncbi:glycosyltransferase family protein [Paenibacillus xanthanilyticus]|uniref:Glycosyltransferase subfamily 4-like N-terminal domain-containing protein n=1 Tax=Paenibacillus xanthanilyticus TaxID=1783531 RepID=A0ABV8K315_9BACL